MTGQLAVFLGGGQTAPQENNLPLTHVTLRDDCDCQFAHNGRRYSFSPVCVFEISDEEAMICLVEKERIV